MGSLVRGIWRLRQSEAERRVREAQSSGDSCFSGQFICSVIYHSGMSAMTKALTQGSLRNLAHFTQSCPRAATDRDIRVQRSLRTTPGDRNRDTVKPCPLWRGSSPFFWPLLFDFVVVQMETEAKRHVGLRKCAYISLCGFYWLVPSIFTRKDFVFFFLLSNLSSSGRSHFRSLLPMSSKKFGFWHIWHFCHTFQPCSWRHRGDRSMDTKWQHHRS